MEDNRQQLLEELLITHTLVKENPCKINETILSAMTEVLHSFIGKYCIDSASKDQVAIYLQRDVRTITRWMKQYNDFPQPRHNGHHEVSFNWIDVVKWKMSHQELYNDSEV